jgi:hypothetical protein
MNVSCCSFFNPTLIFFLQVESLCQLLGSSVLKSVSDKNASSSSYIVLVPDKIDDESFRIDYFPRLVTNQIIPNNKHKLRVDCKLPAFQASKVKFVYFSWLADTISADWVAPLRPHCLGFLEQ